MLFIHISVLDFETEVMTCMTKLCENTNQQLFMIQSTLNQQQIANLDIKPPSDIPTFPLRTIDQFLQLTIHWIILWFVNLW